MSTKLELWQVYSTKRWRQLRAAVMHEAGYLCERCRTAGRTALAAVVHHKTPIQAPWNGEPFERANLQALCRACHLEVHAELDAELQQPDPAREAWDNLVNELAPGGP